MEQKNNMAMDAMTYTKDASGKGVQVNPFQNFNPNSAANQGTLRPGSVAPGPGGEGNSLGGAKPAMAEEGEEEDTKKEMQEHLEALFDGESLSEEFMTKATTIFEAAINQRVNVLREQVVAEAAAVVQEEVETAVNELASRLDDYLGYVVEEWMEDNKLAVENGVRTEIAENFMAGLKELFETHYIEVPEEKYDVSEGLSDVEVSKFASLSEGVDFESLDQYQEKLNILKGSYFNTVPTTNNMLVEETTNKQITQNISSSMNAYMSTLDRIAKQNKI